MKKPFVLIAAIVAVVGLGAAVAVAKENIKVQTSVTVQFRGPDTFHGTVKAEKKVCEKGRTVIVFRHNAAGIPIGSDKSDDRGKYRVFSDEDDPDTGRFAAAAIQKTMIKDNGDKIVCKPGRSEEVELLAPR